MSAIDDILSGSFARGDGPKIVLGGITFSCIFTERDTKGYEIHAPFQDCTFHADLSIGKDSEGRLIFSPIVGESYQSYVRDLFRWGSLKPFFTDPAFLAISAAGRHGLTKITTGLRLRNRETKSTCNKFSRVSKSPYLLLSPVHELLHNWADGDVNAFKEEKINYLGYVRYLKGSERSPAFEKEKAKMESTFDRSCERRVNIRSRKLMREIAAYPLRELSKLKKLSHLPKAERKKLDKKSLKHIWSL